MWQRTIVALGAVWVVCLPLLTYIRVPVWHSETTVWRDAMRQGPEKLRPILNYGNSLARQGSFLPAAQVYTQIMNTPRLAHRPAREYRTAHAIAAANLAVMHWQTGQQAEATRVIRAVLDRYPHFLPAYPIARVLIPDWTPH